MASCFIVPLSDPAATNPDRVGPKAANLAALARAGLPTPGGFCIAADAYHRQIQHLGLGEMIGAYPEADQPTQRRLAVEIRLKLYQSDLAPDVLADVLAAWWETDKPAAVRSSSLIEDRPELNFAGQFESFLGVREDAEFLNELARLLGGAVDHHGAALDGAARAKSRRHRDGGAGAAAGQRARLGRRLERDRRRPDAYFRHLGTGLGDRARRSGAGSRRAHPPRFRALERRRPQASPRGLPARRRNCARKKCRKRWCARHAWKPARRPRSAA